MIRDAIPFDTWRMGQKDILPAQNGYLLILRAIIWSCWAIVAPAVIYWSFTGFPDSRFPFFVFIFGVCAWNIEYSIRKVRYFQISESGITLMPAGKNIDKNEIIGVELTNIRPPGTRVARVHLNRKKFMVVWGKVYFFGNSGHIQWMEDS